MDDGTHKPICPWVPGKGLQALKEETHEEIFFFLSSLTFSCLGTMLTTVAGRSDEAGTHIGHQTLQKRFIE